MTAWRRPATVGAHSGLALFAALLLAAGTGSCRGGPDFGDPSLNLELGISPTPPGVGPARLILTLSDTAGQPISGASIRVEGNMSHAGMVPVIDTAEAVGPGSYAVPAFDFGMAGDWVLTIRATLPDSRWVQIVYETRVFSAPPGIESDTASVETASAARSL